MRQRQNTNGEGEGQRSRSGIKSVEAALSVLIRLASMNRPATLTELALASGMHASKVHRCLASFINLGLVTQRHRSGQYDLGKRAVELGLAAMGRVDIINRASDQLEEIAARTNGAALLTVWGSQGPTIVRWQRIPTLIVSSVGLGTTMPLLNSASGRVFLGFGEESLIAPLVERELKQAKALKRKWADMPPTRAAVKAMRNMVRQNGYATDNETLIAGHYSISVPLLNWQNDIEAALTVVSMDPGLTDTQGQALKYLLQVSRDLSIRHHNGGIPKPHPGRNAPVQSRVHDASE